MFACRFRLFLYLSVLAALSQSVRGQVLVVSVNPNPAIIGQQAQVTVSGNNPCKKFKIDFGDGSTPTITNNVTLPYLAIHAWAAAGAYTIVATGINPCSGQALV